MSTSYETNSGGYVHGRAGGNFFNVLSYGAVGDGFTDSSKAFLKAWEDFCGAAGQPTLVIPAKVFLLTPLAFVGPCRSQKLRIQLQGTLIAPGSINAWGKDMEKWIRFEKINGLTIYGGGKIDGQGKIWWDKCQVSFTTSAINALSFHNCNNLFLSSISHVNSQKNHISINNCKSVEVSQIKITAPDSSPNTDGIDISASSDLNIHDSFIGTGDDCIAINGFSSKINISRVMCGPGHGISIGSLGKDGAYETVEDVHVRDCTFKDTMNGARIKTWKGGRGYVRNISFERITLINSGNPIIIDQEYVNRMVWSPMYSSENYVEISDVTYRGVLGSSSDQRAVYFNCAGGSGCINIVVENVEIKAAEQGKELVAICNNAHGSASFDHSPKVSCLVP
ncbi:Probable polygalacturonase At3g15720 [Linum perenne]